MFIDKIFSPPNMNDNILSCLIFFISGAIVYFLMKKTKKKLFNIFSMLLLILAFIGNFKIFMFCPAILMVVISLEEKLIKFINKPFFSLMGNVTYSTYLLHAPYSIFLILLFKDNIEIYLNPIFFGFYFISLILISSIVYVYIEKKSQTKIRSFYANAIKKIK